ncbi:MAG TPA: hypothetical protein DCM07_02885 [Planctomycetaceae bacterium]|nr:hypothetical protein [Gimesia sp.]HAH43799.1 hypothetical protein [Planctomycetaceae bacterium]HBL45816.1 hypothetical protein [Planctomycetaceae bacterium]
MNLPVSAGIEDFREDDHLSVQRISDAASRTRFLTENSDAETRITMIRVHYDQYPERIPVKTGRFRRVLCLFRRLLKRVKY